MYRYFGDIYEGQFTEKRDETSVLCAGQEKGGCPFDVNSKNCFQLLGFTSS